MSEFKIMGIKSMENRSLNKELTRYDRFEAMRDARQFTAEGLDVVIVNDDNAVVYANCPYWEYFFENAVSGAWIDAFAVSYTDAVGDVHTPFRVFLGQSYHLSHLLTQLVEFEQLGRQRQQVPELLNPDSIRWKLLCGYLQTLGIPSGTTWCLEYPAELESWLNRVFYYAGEDLQYVSFSNGVVTVN
jgi:hypothetical protein